MTVSLLLLLLALQAPASGPAPMAPQLNDWREAHGSSWQLSMSEESAFAEMLYGGRVSPAVTPKADSDWFGIARTRIREARAMLGVDAGTLIDGRVLFLPLGWIGTTDKYAVSMTQSLEGVQVEGASANLLFDSSGGLLSIQSSCAVGELSSSPFELDEADAGALTLAVFAGETGLDGELTAQPRRAWWPMSAGGVRPVWISEVLWEAPSTEAVGRHIVLDAGDGAVLSSYSTIQNFDVTGSVRTLVTPGELPDWPTNLEVWAPVPYVNLTGSFGMVQTDANGDFTIPGVTGPIDVTATFLGEYAKIQNQMGPNLTVTTSVVDGGQISMNTSATEFDTGQSNCYLVPGLMRDWVRAINPSDDTGDFQATIRANVDLHCNATFHGGYIETRRTNGVCPNTGYASIIAHEMGHWFNARYFTYGGDPWDGMGEGAADVFAMYLYDTPIVGEDFWCESCGPLRTGHNMRQFCGDENAGCHAGPHANGEVFMGALWKVRENLNSSLGDASGDLAADSLWFGWNNVFNQQNIREIIETQWILLDDDDGDIFNGSPHFAEIDAAFRAQGWPGLEIQPITIDLLQSVDDTEVERGPYTVKAVIEDHFGHAITHAEVMWSVGDGAWSSSELVLQEADTYLGSVPDVPAPALIKYYLRATDAGGNVQTNPVGAPTLVHSFSLGVAAPTYTADFDDPASDQGWTHGSYGDTANGADDWQRGWPQGAFGNVLYGSVNVNWADPSAPVSGGHSWGNDLGLGTDGRYPNNAHMWLRSPVIDASNWMGCRLRFQRQLSVVGDDVARVLGGGGVIYETDHLAGTSDMDWTAVEYDISDIADGDSAFVLEWELLTDGVPRIGGWNIDDVEILRLVPSTSTDCLAPITYGPGKVHSGNAIAEVSHVGQPAVGANFAVKIEYAVASQPSILFSGVNAVQIPFAGGHRLASGNLQRNGAAQLSLAGAASYGINVTPQMAGATRFYQVWFRDPTHLDGTGVGLSPGLRVDYCL